MGKGKKPERSRYHNQYKEADKYIVVNHDDDLFPITIDLPQPPPLHEVEGYGLPPHKQFWKPPKYPHRLKKLESQFETMDEIYDHLEFYSDSYQDEINWIQDQWKKRQNGHWVFINGKPTYIDGWHYFFLSFWRIDIGLPRYRSRDRKFFIFAKWVYTSTEAFYGYRVADGERYRYFPTWQRANEFAQDNKEIEEGNFKVDMGRRLLYGFNYPKHRREGATYRASCLNFLITTSFFEAQGGLQSMDGSSATKAFKKGIVNPWKKLPFFFRPYYSGKNNNPQKELKFGKVSGGQSLIQEPGLESVIEAAESANAGWFDGDKLVYFHNDECGKIKDHDINHRQGIVNKCLAQGNGAYIFGLSVNTSTVGEMDNMGGKNFFRLCQNSHYESRDNNGQTQSGLVNFFQPAQDGLEGFIDIFGNSIIEDPEEDDLWRIPRPMRDSSGKLMGARRFLEEKRSNLLSRDDPESLSAYEEEVRLHPMSFSECFISKSSDLGFNLKKLNDRYKELEFDRMATRPVTFRWKDNHVDGQVEMIDDPKGRWRASMVLSPEQANKRVKKTVKFGFEYKEVYAPQYPGIFTSSSDAFLFRKVRSGSGSNGGGAIFWNRDTSIDPDEKPIEYWESNRFVCTYNYRPATPEEFAEDMLLMTVYFGAMHFPEINVPVVWHHFEERGYLGYLLYQRLPNGKYAANPGFNTKGSFSQNIFGAHQQYIEDHIHRERHIEIIQEQKDIKGVDDMTHYDLFTAAGGCLVGATSDHAYRMAESNKYKHDLAGYI